MSKSHSTIRLYDNDSHEKSFIATVLSCTPCDDFFKVELNQTAFFPEGGGQYADKGSLAPLSGDAKPIEVIDVQIDDSIIYHHTREKLSPGCEVMGSIDWETRFIRMQNHSGEHIISGLAHKLFSLDNIGFHLGDGYVTCDYNGQFTKEQTNELELEANGVVFANLPITTYYPSADKLGDLNYRSKLDLAKDVRLVEIPGVDLCACCAPHVNHTGEIGLIKIVNSEKCHGGTRLHLRCGYFALFDYNEKQVNTLRIMDLLSARQFETADCVEKLLEANSNLSSKLSRASVKFAKQKLDGVESSDDNLVVLLEDADQDALLALANGGRRKTTGVFVALTNCESGYRYMITGNNLPLSQLAKEFNACLVGRGGGKDDLIQGVFSSALPVIEEFFKSWKYEK